MRCDATQPDSVDGVVRDAVASLGGLDVLVHAAGLWHPGVLGRIVNFGSSEGVVGSPMSAAYAASKSAVASWTRSAAKTWAAAGITVNALAPAVETLAAQRLRDFLGPDLLPLVEQQIAAMIPLAGKLGDPTRDLGPVRVLLAGDGALFITGQSIAVDGGLMTLGA